MSALLRRCWRVDGRKGQRAEGERKAAARTAFQGDGCINVFVHSSALLARQCPTQQTSSRLLAVGPSSFEVCYGGVCTSVVKYDAELALKYIALRCIVIIRVGAIR
jgi:hypothetical protein